MCKAPEPILAIRSLLSSLIVIPLLLRKEVELGTYDESKVKWWLALKSSSQVLDAIFLKEDLLAIIVVGWL